MDKANAHRLVLAGALALTAIVPGCNGLCVNMYKDELATVEPVSTASVDGIRASGAAATDRNRPHELATIAPVSGVVDHGPLYFDESPFDLGDEDDQFVWTLTDLVFGYYASGRALVNAALFPVSVAVAPPWQVTESDGRPSRTAWWHEVDDTPRVDH